MTTWIKRNWRWALLNAVGVAAMANVLRHLDKINMISEGTFDPFIECGKWAVRFLLFSLLMTPLNKFFGWRSAVPLRKPAGLWAFGFGFVHFLMYVYLAWPYWLGSPISDLYAGLGAAALFVLALMASTSTRWAMKRMGKWWKRLHRLVYFAGVAALVHGLLESSSKRAFISNPQAGAEVVLYLVILALLMAARIPGLRINFASLRPGRSQTEASP